MQTLLLLLRFIVYRVAQVGVFSILLISTHLTQAQTFDWNGALSNDWAEAGNWTPEGIPGEGSTVNISSDDAPNPCQLDGNRSIAVLAVSAGELDLNGFQLTTTAQTSVTGGIVASGSISASNITDLSGGTFNGTITITKTGAGDDFFAGDNVFNGLVTIINDGEGRIRMANTTGDVFNDDAVFINNSTEFFDVAFDGGNQFNGNVTLNCTGTGRMSLGARNLVTATSTITNGGALLTSGFESGQLLLRRLTQQGSAANGSFKPASAVLTDCTFGGELSIESSSTVNITSCQFESTVTLDAATDVLVTGSNGFSTLSGAATIIRRSSDIDRFSTGPNTFGNLHLINNGTGLLRLGGTNGDTFTGTTRFTNTNSGDLQIAHNGSNTFAGDIILSNSGTGSITFGGETGTSVQSAGSILVDSFQGVPLTINRFTQLSSSPNDLLEPSIFRSLGCSFNGAFSVQTDSSIIQLDGCSFTSDCSFTPATELILLNANSFSTLSGSAVFTIDTGATANANWTGGNTFGDMVLNHNGSGRVTLATTNGDSFTGKSTFNLAGTGDLQIAFNGTNTFNDTIVLSNTGSGTLSFGLGTGTSLQTAAHISSSDVTGGGLTINGFTQQSTSANDALNPTEFSASNSSFNGNFTLTTTSGTLSLNGCNFTASNVFTSASNILVTNANSFSTVSGSTSFTINGGAATNWTGGNTFGPLTIVHNSSNFLRLGVTNPDSFTGTATFTQLSTGALQPAYNSDNTFSGDISVSGTSSPITFGANLGRVILNGSTTQNLNGNPGEPVVIRRLTMNTGEGGGLLLNVPLSISSDLSWNNGIIQTSAANILTLTDETVTTTIGNANAYVQGPMRYTMSTANSARSTLHFALGKGGAWRPATLQISHTTATPYTYQAEMFNESAWDLGWTRPATVRNVSDIRYWDISRYESAGMTEEPELHIRTGASGPIITLHFGLDDIVLDGDDLVVVKNTPAEPNAWIDIGGSGAPEFNGGNLLQGSVTSTSDPGAFNSFSTFTLGSFGANPLPVTLVYFEATTEQRAVALNWETATEVNSQSFVVERSSGAEPWEAVGAPVTAAGNSTQPLKYQHWDEQPALGWNYYRLRQLDLDGTETLSGVASVFFNGKVSDVMPTVVLYPNPGRDRVYLRAMPGTAMNRWMQQEVRIYHSTGQLVHRQTLDQGLDTPIHVDALQAGVYILEFGEDIDQVRLPLMVE